MTSTKNVSKLTKHDKQEITRSVYLAVNSYVKNGFLYTSHIGGSPLFDRIRTESKSANEAIDALLGNTKGVLGGLVHATVALKDSKLLSLLRPHLDEPTQCIVDGITSALEPVDLRTDKTDTKVPVHG
jgi:hypothetical protein